MKKLIFLLLLLPMLPACVPAMMFMGGATVGGMVIYDKRDMKTMLADHNISYRSEQLLNANEELKKNSHIGVVSFNRVVLLVGQASTSAYRAKAVALVRTVPKIRKIYNQITIGKPTSFMTRMHDSSITSKVKMSLLSHEGFKSTQLKVVTENGVVYLMGLVPPAKATQAAQVARKISGVQQVVKIFETPR